VYKRQATFSSSIATGIPTSGTGNPTYKLGNRVTNVVVFDTNHFIEVEIGGVAYRLALAL
jgi:hypothetical protein